MKNQVEMFGADEFKSAEFGDDKKAYTKKIVTK